MNDWRSVIYSIKECTTDGGTDCTVVSVPQHRFGFAVSRCPMFSFRSPLVSNIQDVLQFTLVAIPCSLIASQRCQLRMIYDYGITVPLAKIPCSRNALFHAFDRAIQAIWLKPHTLDDPYWVSLFFFSIRVLSWVGPQVYKDGFAPLNLFSCVHVAYIHFSTSRPSVAPARRCRQPWTTTAD